MPLPLFLPLLPVVSFPTVLPFRWLWLDLDDDRVARDASSPEGREKKLIAALDTTSLPADLPTALRPLDCSVLLSSPRVQTRTSPAASTTRPWLLFSDETQPPPIIVESDHRNLLDVIQHFRPALAP